jgi:hypothetical protein
MVRMLYRVPEHSQDNEYEVATPYDDPLLVAEAAADDYFDEHDGWESRWPLVFRLFTEDGEEVGDFLVELEARPHFSAGRVEK